MRPVILCAVFLFALGLDDSANASSGGNISAGDHHTCVLSSHSMVYCWGDNTLGQLGNGRRLGDIGIQQKVSRPVQVLNPEGNGPLLLIAEVAAGYTHTCARTLVGSDLLCWGDGILGELGDGRASIFANLPGFVLDGKSKASISNTASVSAGRYYSCALIYESVWINTYSVACWGSGNYGELGDNSFADEGFPLPLSYPYLSLTQVSTGGEHTCAVDDEEHVWCWGDNYSGELGDGGHGNSYVPTEVMSSSGFAALSAVHQITLSANNTCALMIDTTVFCWGDNESGELGNGTGLSSSALPMQVIEQSGAPLQNVTAIAGGGDHICALKANTTVLCWGENNHGELGNNDTRDSRLPLQVVDASGAPIEDVMFIAAGSYHTCAVKRDGSVWCWGGNGFGQLGNGTLENSSVAVPVDFDTIFTDGYEGI
jgi:alpha-tubulin suppressor-like RCC1 family protein